MSGTLFASLDREDTVRWEANLRTGQWVTAFAGVGALSALLYHPATGAASSAIAIVTFAWFTAARKVKGRTQTLLWAITPTFALALPSIIIVVVAAVQDVQTAFALWVPPIITVCVLALSTARLEPLRPAAYALVATALYLAAWLGLTWDLPQSTMDRFAQLRPYEQVVRSAFLLGAGVALSMVTRGLRATIEVAARRDRENVLFGKYRLGKPIASGGMASVVEATYCPEGGFERAAAVKRIHPHLVTEPGVVEQFRAEAELGARLAHPNIVAVLDFGRVQDTYFLAMEHVAGIDLRTLMLHCRRLKIRLPPRIAAFVAHQVLEGLHFAHAGARDKDGKLLRVVHRDLTPGNVLVARTGDVKVTDFGIACALKEETWHHTGRVIGSLPYLAPEQVARCAFDHRADLFAVGVVLHEMLAGRRLFKRDSTSATLLAIMNDHAPRLALCGVPAAWDELFKRALARNPADRFPTARAMADAVESVLMRTNETLPHADELADFLHHTGALDRNKREAAAAAVVARRAHDDDTDIDEALTVRARQRPEHEPNDAPDRDDDDDIASLPTDIRGAVVSMATARTRRHPCTERDVASVRSDHEGLLSLRIGSMPR